MLFWQLIPWLISVIVIGRCSYDDLKSEQEEKVQIEQRDSLAGHCVEGEDCPDKWTTED